jgi:hypothetical protein
MTPIEHRPEAPTYTLVTVAYADDQPFVDLQARSLQLYLSDEPSFIEKIIVVDNFEIRKLNRSGISAHLGRLASRTEFLSLEDFPALPTSAGWMRQQALKLLVARRVETPRYILLDAKNHLVGPLTREHVETPEGCLMRSRLLGYRNHSLTQFVVNAIDYFGLDPGMLDSFTPSTTPFPMSTDLVKSLLTCVEDREQQEFGRWFCERPRAARVSEFAMYGAFLAFAGGGFSRLYHLHNPSPATVWKDSVDQFDKTLVAARQQQSFFGVHRRAFGQLDDRQRRDLARLWVRSGLFSSEKRARFFIDECAKYYV